MDKMIGTKAQGYASKIENLLKKAYQLNDDVGRTGFGGQVTSDFIIRNPLAAFSGACGFIYANADENKKIEIEEFIKMINHHLNFPLEELLSFDKQEKNGYELDYSNGIEAIEEIIEMFSNIIG